MISAMPTSVVEKLYYNTHTVELFSKNGLSEPRVVLIDVDKKHQCLDIKLRDQNDFSFNFTTNIDWNIFEKMKFEQCLEICFEEFHLHFIDLLKQASSNQMLLKLEESNSTCKMVFYERSKIKSLIFLIVDLILREQKDIIEEMAQNINQLKDSNRNVSSQLTVLKNQLYEKDTLLNVTLTTSDDLRKQFLQSVTVIKNSASQSLDKIEKCICNKIGNLSKRYDKLMKEIDAVKRENKYKENIYSQTIFQLEQFKRDNEKNYKTIDSLKIELEILNSQRIQNDNIISDLRQTVSARNRDIEHMNGEIAELRKDIQEATIIIAQKTKTHDEIAKDLVQANTMLVNFNKQVNVMTKELDGLQAVIRNKNQTIEEQNLHITKLNDDFNKYKKEYNFENLDVLQHELRKSKEKIEELEKCNREATKINGLLTKKLAASDTYDSGNMHFTYPK